MNVTVNPAVRKEVPICFGKEWERDATECVGGADANYTDAQGKHVRSRCDYYEACGARVQMAKGAGAVVPQNQLVRPLQPPQPPTQVTFPIAIPQGPTNFNHWLQQRTSTGVSQTTTPPPPQKQIVPTYYQSPPLHVPPPVQMVPQVPAQHYPAGNYQLNYMVPTYLSQPETRRPGETVWPALLREILRGVGKSLGHTLASFFDRTPM